MNNAQQEIYRQCLAKVAPVENMRMRQRMGRATAEDTNQETTQDVLKMLAALGEATVDDLAYKMKMKRTAVMGHVSTLLSNDEITADRPCGHKLPAILSVKK